MEEDISKLWGKPHPCQETMCILYTQCKQKYLLLLLEPNKQLPLWRLYIPELLFAIEKRSWTSLERSWSSLVIWSITLNELLDPWMPWTSEIIIPENPTARNWWDHVFWFTSPSDREVWDAIQLTFGSVPAVCHDIKRSEGFKCLWK
jgi:hypothetical protein